MRKNIREGKKITIISERDKKWSMSLQLPLVQDNIVYGEGFVSSDGLRDTDVALSPEYYDEEDRKFFNAKIEGVERLVLALAIEGVDVNTPSMKLAIENACKVGWFKRL